MKLQKPLKVDPTRALGYSIFTQGDDWYDLKAMVKDAVACHFGEKEVPKVILRS